MLAPTSLRFAVFVLFAMVCARLGAGQQPSADVQTPDQPGKSKTAKAEKPSEPPKLPVIADEPKTVDPADFMPKTLAQKATVDLSDSSLIEVVNWLKEKQGIDALLDTRAMTDAGLLPTEPISDRLNDQPIYFLLNRLDAVDMDWYVKDGIVHLAPKGEIEHFTTAPYNIGDLLDAEYDAEAIVEMIESTVATTTWENVGGSGAISILGDVLFVRQTDDVQRQVKGALAALRKHGRMTFFYDPPQHAVIRENLEQPVSVDFMDTPLETAVAELAEKTEVDIRLEMRALRDARIRRREPITLSLEDYPLKTVLQVTLKELDLTYHLRDGALWVTTPEATVFKTAVYDVRDLCRDEGESDALEDAITSQAEPSSWEDVGGPGAIAFAKPGTMVVSHTENMLLETLALLETYRAALRASKPRDRDAAYENEVITQYYRMDATAAADLAQNLPKLVAPETWRTEARPDAVGTILRMASSPEILTETADGETPYAAFLEKQAVLVITHTRASHDKIAEVIGRVENGDPRFSGGNPMMMGGGMGGMGGFGGGFYALPITQPGAPPYRSNATNPACSK